MRLELTRAKAHYPLKVARLPIPPSGLDFPDLLSHRALSEKRGSNPRPQPWQGCALPTELFSHLLFIYEKPSRFPFFASAKIDSFFYIRKLYQRKLLIFLSLCAKTYSFDLFSYYSSILKNSARNEQSSYTPLYSRVVVVLSCFSTPRIFIHR